MAGGVDCGCASPTPNCAVPTVGFASAAINLVEIRGWLRCAMSFVSVAPELLSAAAGDVANLGWSVGAANAAAVVSTTQLVAAAHDEVSAAVMPDCSAPAAPAVPAARVRRAAPGAPAGGCSAMAVPVVSAPPAWQVRPVRRRVPPATRAFLGATARSVVPGQPARREGMAVWAAPAVAAGSWSATAEPAEPAASVVRVEVALRVVTAAWAVRASRMPAAPAGPAALAG